MFFSENIVKKSPFLFAVPKQSTTFATHLKKDCKGALVQLVRIHACHAWGHGFESRTHRKSLPNNLGGSFYMLARELFDGCKSANSCGWISDLNLLTALFRPKCMSVSAETDIYFGRKGDAFRPKRQPRNVCQRFCDECSGE